jgi:hypothetical protein
VANKVFPFEELEPVSILMLLEEKRQWVMLTGRSHTMSMKHVLPDWASPKTTTLSGFGSLENNMMRPEAKKEHAMLPKCVGLISR